MRLPSWLHAWRRVSRSTHLPEPLWRHTLGALPFLAALSPPEQQGLGELVAVFLHRKRFHGAAGLRVSDAMALSVAAQACLPLLHWPGSAAQRLRWYDDFVGIVLYPGELRARRELTDDHGVVHQWQEDLLGEAMDDGPIALAWAEVSDAPRAAERGCNLVIHEFAHKLDLRDGTCDGCPPLPAGFAGQGTARQARTHWQTVLARGYQQFRERVICAERFGAAPTWLDPYGASTPGEFFAVACEAYFMQPGRLATEWPEIHDLLQAFFRPGMPDFG